MSNITLKISMILAFVSFLAVLIFGVLDDDLIIKKNIVLKNKVKEIDHRLMSVEKKLELILKHKMECE